MAAWLVGGGQLAVMVLGSTNARIATDMCSTSMLGAF